MGATKKLYEQMMEERHLLFHTTELSPCYRCGVYMENDFLNIEGLCDHCYDDMHYKG